MDRTEQPINTQLALAWYDGQTAGELWRENYEHWLQVGQDGVPKSGPIPQRHVCPYASSPEHPKDVAIRELVEALRLTWEYVGYEMLPPAPGWTFFDALAKHAPSVAARMQNDAMHLAAIKLGRFSADPGMPTANPGLQQSSVTPASTSEEERTRP